MKVLLVGATGATGLETLVRLGDHEVTALVRSGRDVPGVRVVTGDAKNPADLERAAAGQDAVVSVLGSKRIDPGGLQTAFLTGIVAAMEHHGSRRLITLSPWGTGASHDSAPLPLRIGLATLLSKQTADREAGERSVAASGLDYTLVRAGVLTNGAQRGGVVAAAGGRGIRLSISRADVAAFLVAQLEDTAWLRGEPVIGYAR